MRSVLFVHGSSDLYGADLACVYVAEAAVDKGWDVTVTVPWDGPLIGRLQAAGAEVTMLDPLKLRRADLAPGQLPSTASRWARSWRRLRQLGDERRRDLVYTTTAPTIGGLVLARRWRAPHVYHVHELFWQPRPLVAVFERVLDRADLVICCSTAVAEQFRRQGLRAKCVVAPTGATVPIGLHERTPFERPGCKVACVARLNEWKGQEVLIDAAARLRPELPGLRVHLVGDVYRGQAFHREQLMTQVRGLGLDDVVVFEGERRDAAQIVADSDVFVLPSRRPEPFGMALVEAMLLGRPVVATDAGGPKEIVTHGRDGLLVPPNDAGALAQALRQLHADPARAVRLGEHARHRAAELSPDRMVERVLEAFERLTS
jgi:glycosyltransferase involved in cell wall biosynthesis